MTFLSLIQNPATVKDNILQQLKILNIASRKLVRLSDKQIAIILNKLADETLENISFLLTENKKDLDRMDPEDPKFDRLLLNEKRLHEIANDLRKVASLPSPLYKTIEERKQSNGLDIKRISVPIGVIGIVYESRPNVTFDVFALCLKSGNASVLKGSRDAHFSNIAIMEIIQKVLTKYDLSDVTYLAPSERESLGHILSADQFIDIIIPRGGQGLIDFVRKNSRVPVIETGAGIVHTYYDKSADLEKGKKIIENAKSRRVSVCNALDTLIIHKERLNDLPVLLKNLDQEHHCEVFADASAYSFLKGNYSKNLLHHAELDDFGTEFLSMKMSVKTVENVDEALDHISNFSSKHSEAIIAEDTQVVEYFLKNTDAAVVYANTSTAFTDGGQFGLGAEIGISTQKLHARGPMALRELTSYKWIVKSDGQIRPK